MQTEVTAATGYSSIFATSDAATLITRPPLAGGSSLSSLRAPPPPEELSIPESVIELCQSLSQRESQVSSHTASFASQSSQLPVTVSRAPMVSTLKRFYTMNIFCKES